MFTASKEKRGKQFRLGLCFGLAVFLSTAMPSPVDAQHAITCTMKTGCSDWNQHRHRTHVVSARHQIEAEVARADANGNAVIVIGGRPPGCPHAYCGCGLRKYLGLSDKRLNLAWNWAVLFPRTSARPGAAAVRHHHVMLLVRHVSGSNWVVRDYNSGKGLSRIHVQNVRHYVFVSPHAKTKVVMSQMQ